MIASNPYPHVSFMADNTLCPSGAFGVNGKCYSFTLPKPQQRRSQRDGQTDRKDLRKKEAGNCPKGAEIKVVSIPNVGGADAGGGGAGGGSGNSSSTLGTEVRLLYTLLEAANTEIYAGFGSENSALKNGMFFYVFDR